MNDVTEISPTQDEVDTSGYHDFFATGPQEKFILPVKGEEQWLMVNVLNEGDRRKFERKTQRPVSVKKNGDSQLSFDSGEIRQSKILAAVSDWHVMIDGKFPQFSERKFKPLLNAMPVEMVDALYAKVEELNPWATSEETLEALEEERDELDERIAAMKLDLGKDND